MAGGLVRLLPGLLCLFAAAANASEEFDKLLSQALATHPAVEGRRAGLEAARADREGSEWHRTERGAIKRASEMRDAKITALQRQIAKLKALRFDK